MSIWYLHGWLFLFLFYAAVNEARQAFVALTDDEDIAIPSKLYNRTIGGSGDSQFTIEKATTADELSEVLDHWFDVFDVDFPHDAQMVEGSATAEKNGNLWDDITLSDSPIDEELDVYDRDIIQHDGASGSGGDKGNTYGIADGVLLQSEYHNDKTSIEQDQIAAILPSYDIDGKTDLVAFPERDEVASGASEFETDIIFREHLYNSTDPVEVDIKTRDRSYSVTAMTNNSGLGSDDEGITSFEKISYEGVDEIEKVLSSAHICIVDACPSSCRTNNSVNTGMNLKRGRFVHVTALSISDLAGTLSGFESLRLSCGDSSRQSSVQIVEHGCKVNLDVFTDTGVGSSPCISFRVPTVMSCSSVLLHARLVSCSIDDVEMCINDPAILRCTNSEAKRSRRHATWPAEHVAGPFRIYGTNDGDVSNSKLSAASSACMSGETTVRVILLTILLHRISASF